MMGDPVGLHQVMVVMDCDNLIVILVNLNLVRSEIWPLLSGFTPLMIITLRLTIVKPK